MKISLLVVLYNSTIDGSVTIKSLLQSMRRFEGFSILVWNNGPKEIARSELGGLEALGFDVNFIQDLDNRPLSVVYNSFLKSSGADFNVILDHDSLLSSGYLDFLIGLGEKKSSGFYIGVPIISFGGIPVYPILKSRKKKNKASDDELVRSIGSGLVIGSTTIDVMLSRFGNVFDERFALYGVDTTFFMRVQIMSMSSFIEIVPGFEHSLSRLENEDLQLEKFRSSERGWDCGLRLINYFEWRYISMSLKELVKRVVGFDYIFVFAFIRAIISSKHKRC